MLPTWPILRANCWRRFTCAVALSCCLLFVNASNAQNPVQIQSAAYINQPTLPPEPIAAPQPRPQLGLADLEQMALTCNPTLAKAQAQVQVARGQWVQVGLPPNPSVGYSGQQIGSGGVAEQHGVYVMQEIVRGGKLNLNRQAAAHEIARAEQGLVTQQFRVLTDVRIAFHQVLIAQRQIDLATQIADSYRRAVDTTQRLLDAKEVSRIELLQAKLELESMSAILRAAQHRHAAAWQSLTAVVGQPQLPPQALAGEVSAQPKEFDYQQTLQHLLTASPEIAAAASNIEKARWQLHRAVAEKKGNVNLQALYNWQDNGIGGRPDGALVVDMPIPIWNKNQGGIIQAQGEITIAERTLQQLELDLQQRLAPVYERYQNARQQVARQQSTVIPLARESLDLSLKAYQAGELSYLALLLAERSHAQANLTYLDSLRDLRQAEAEMEGFLLQNSLQAR